MPVRTTLALLLVACSGSAQIAEDLADAGANNSSASDAAIGADAPGPSDAPTTGSDAMQPPPPPGDVMPPPSPPSPVWSPLPVTTSFQSWSPYYPMNRNQGRGNRWANLWVQPGDAPQELLLQATWQFPDANDGTGSNRPNASLPATFGMPGVYGAHAVEYFLNINCNTPGECDHPDRYHEVISENQGATFLELWGAGGRGGFVAYLDDQALAGGCTLGNAQTMMQAIANNSGASYREPLAFPLPAQPGYVGVGNVTCEVLLDNYATATRARLALVVTENRGEQADASLDPSGQPWRILFARNIYYIEKTAAGGCAPGAPDVVARVPLPGGATRDVAFCAQNYEVYAMRSIPANHRGWNGFGSWNNSVDPACTTVNDCAAHGGNLASWNRHWTNNSLAPAFYQRCSLGAAGLTCQLLAPPPGA